MLLNLLNAIILDIWSHNMFCKNNLEYKTFMKLFCKGQFLPIISGEDRDEPLLPMVGEEIEIEAEESQDQEVRDDYEHEAEVDPIHDPLANVTKKSDIHWHHTSFIPVDTTWESPTTDPREPLTVRCLSWWAWLPIYTQNRRESRGTNMPQLLRLKSLLAFIWQWECLVFQE